MYLFSIRILLKIYSIFLILLKIIQSWPGVTRTETQIILSDYKMIQKITGQLANYLKENPNKASTTLDVIQEVFQLDIKAHE